MTRFEYDAPILERFPTIVGGAIVCHDLANGPSTPGLAEAFRAHVVDATTDHFVFEITGRITKIENFINLMKPLGLVEVARTGAAAIARGPEPM